MKPKRGNQRMAVLWMGDGLRFTNTLSLCLAAYAATQRGQQRQAGQCHIVRGASAVRAKLPLY